MTGAEGGRACDAPPPALSAAEIARLAGGDVLSGDPGVQVRGAAADSREIAPGMLFVALAGSHTDGHRFVADARRRGAAAALVAAHAAAAIGGGAAAGRADAGFATVAVPDPLRALHRLARAVRDRRGLRVAGITGSVGKTSTKEMAAAVAAQAFRTARSPENWNTEIGVPLVLLNLPADREVAVLEMAMRGPGQIRELVEIAAPQIGAVTNIGESHLDFFPSREALAAAKGELVEGLPPDGCAILNAEDPLAWALRGRTRARVLSFGVERGDVRARDLRVRPGRGSEFLLVTPRGQAPVALRIPGRHAVQNALAAAAVGEALGIDPARAAAGLGAAAPLPMRLEIVPLDGAVLLNDVYNSSPQSAEAALALMDEIEGAGPRIAVLGDMKELGAHTVDAHRRVGRDAARRRVDMVLAFGPLAAEIAAAAREAGGIEVRHTERADEVVETLRRLLRPGAVVLIKGSRAMAMERITEALTRGAGRRAGAAPPAGAG
jgi:UDP-N-acetylmuramoyl-tripeptide--D-alanyl-D-alanine ligase